MHDYHLHLIFDLCVCRDQAANILFDDIGEDLPIPAYILEALLKVGGEISTGHTHTHIQGGAVSLVMSGTYIYLLVNGKYSLHWIDPLFF